MRSAAFTVRLGVVVGMLTVACTLLAAPDVRGAVIVFEKEDFSLALGLRIQPRMELDRAAGETEWRRDFLVRRTRIAAQGKMLEAQYKIEWKIDNTDRLNPATPSAQLENGYIQYPLGAGVELRAGLYDLPYSRDLLTSDSKHLAVDRGAVSSVPSALGLVDNGVGFQLMGNVRGGRAQYAVGLFDNRTIPQAFQDFPMLVGRLDLNFGSTQNIFMDAHFGDESWYSLGINGSYQGGLEDGTGADDGSNGMAGIDGMIDVPAGFGRLFARAEANAIQTEDATGADAIDTSILMAGAGLLVLEQRLQPMVRFDHVRLDDSAGGGTTDITHMGANWYQKQHNLKVQADVRFESGTGESVDGVRLQGQIDF
jgi:phosphate-selective porin O/P